MSDEKQAFSQRLADAMRAKGYVAKPGVLLKLFNSRYSGRSVAFSTASKWLRGLILPEQDKMRVLASLVGMAPHELQYGAGKVRVGEGKANWAESMGQQELAMVDAYLSLPPAQRKLVRELIVALAAKSKHD